MSEITNPKQSKLKKLETTTRSIGLVITIFTSVVTVLGAVLEVISAIESMNRRDDDAEE